MSRTLLITTLTLTLTVLSIARGEPPTEPLGVGDTIPAGHLKSETDRDVDLRSLVAEAPTVLIFYRGGWCPYCRRHLADLAEVVPALDEAGFRILAISPDQPSKLRAKPDFGELPYTLLSDSSMSVSSAFGIAFRVDDELVEKYMNSYGIDLEGDSGETHHLLPHPAVYIVDTEGVIQYAHVDPNYKERLDPDEILTTANSVAE